MYFIYMYIRQQEYLSTKFIKYTSSIGILPELRLNETDRLRTLVDFRFQLLGR